jgi:hypothetical protein
MSTPEPTPTDGPWATLCQSRPQPYARVDFIPQLGTKNFASGVLYLVVLEHGENYTVRLNSEIWPKITDNICISRILGPEQKRTQEGTGTS